MDPDRAPAAPSPALVDLPRCAWADDPLGDALMTRYHDEEWGVPAGDDVELFERLALESFQAGLSWRTILRKREAFRRAFGGFRPAVVAGFGAADVARLLADEGIVRNRAKVEATIANARAFWRRWNSSTRPITNWRSVLVLSSTLANSWVSF